MTLRVNLKRTTLPALPVLLLGARGFSAPGGPLVPRLGLTLLIARARVQELPGFLDGLVSVQDAGAQLATAAARSSGRGERVLDACAAPGGKTGALLEAADGPVEIVGNRRGRNPSPACPPIISSACASRAQCDLLAGLDAARSRGGIQRQFDHCSWSMPLFSHRGDPSASGYQGPASGTPISTASSLSSAGYSRSCGWAMLRPGGRLLYCHLLAAAGRKRTTGRQRLLAELPAYRPLESAAGVALPPHTQRRESRRAAAADRCDTQTDGFYYACLENTTAGP